MCIERIVVIDFLNEEDVKQLVQLPAIQDIVLDDEVIT